ncbi:Hsp70 family protein [Streptomyces sp. NPDC018955]|uniref:Hsp70 family protein n=1 Tax=Streptomyces sp. NPDC018955 TaxID=3365055 RepID=UPI00378946E0
MIGIDLGHRFGRVGRIGPDGGPAVDATELDGVDGVRDPQRALPLLFGPAPSGTAAAAAEPDRQAVLGIPASGGREDELRRAAESAGLDVARVVPDPVAVALHYGAVSEGVDRTVLVCDQGATTLDLTVLAITPDLTVRVVRTRSHPLGGDDWDAALAALLAGRLPDGVDPRRAAELLRRAPGGSDRVTGTVADGTGGRHRLDLDRADFERAVTPLRERALAAVAGELSTAEPAVDTVLLAGGLCAMPGRQAEIEELPAAQGLTVRCHLPELAVVRGLLELRDFGVLRIVTGPAAGPARTDDRYLLPDALTAPAPVPDPDPRPWQPLPEDPEPEARRDAPPPAPAGTRQVPATPPRTAEDGRPPRPGHPRPPAPDTGPPPAPSTPSTVPGPRPAPEDSQPSPAAPGPAGPARPRAAAQEPRPDPYASHPVDPPAPSPAGPPAGPPADPRAHLALPVGRLQALRRGDHLLVLWAWPDGALSARVRWRREGGTAGPDGVPRDGDMICRRRVYEHDGGLELAVGRDAVTLTVEALVADSGADCEGASSLLVPAQAPVVEYEPSVRRRLKGRVASVAFTSVTGCDLPALRIVHSLGRFRPTSTAEGTVLHEVPAQRLPAGTPLTVEFPLPATRGPSWLVCFPADGNAATDAAVEIRPTALHRLRVT